MQFNMRLTGIGICAFYQLGCTTPYSLPVFEQEFTETAPQGFDGIAQHLEAGDTRILWIHGMCDHGADWVKDSSDRLLRSLNARQIETPLPVRLSAQTDEEKAETISKEAMVNGKRLELKFLLWSPLTRDYKKALEFDNDTEAGGRFPYKRASLNRALKRTLLNKCLIDAVIYGGPNGDSIRSWAKQAVCEGLGGIFNARNEACSALPSGFVPRTVIVAESLGSKVILDAIESIWSGNRTDTMAAQLASVQQIFMVSNQVPLLSTAGVADNKAANSRPVNNGLNALLEAQARVRKSTAIARRVAAPLPPLQIIAFTDPNDLFSYRLSSAHIGTPKVQVINVIVSNAPTSFGLFARPDHVHCGYRWNRYVLGTIVHGYSRGRAFAVDASLSKECGLAGDRDARRSSG